MIFDGPGTTNAFEAPMRARQTAARAPFIVTRVEEVEGGKKDSTCGMTGSYGGASTRCLWLACFWSVLAARGVAGSVQQEGDWQEQSEHDFSCIPPEYIPGAPCEPPRWLGVCPKTLRNPVLPRPPAEWSPLSVQWDDGAWR